MKYANEVMEIMEAYPHREFKMITLIKTINPNPTKQQSGAIRVGILRVLESLISTGKVKILNAENRQGKRYQWVL